MTYQLPEPSAMYPTDHSGKRRPLFTEAQLREAYAAGQRDTREAAVCDPDDLSIEQGDDGATGVYRVEKAIRALPIETI